VISNIVLLTVIEPPVLAISVFVITVLSVIVLVSPLLVATVLNVTLFLINVLIVMFPLTIVRDLIPLSVNFSTVLLLILLLIVVVVVVLAGIVPVRSTLDKATGPVRTKLVRGGEQRLWLRYGGRVPMIEATFFGAKWVLAIFDCMACVAAGSCV
jgi:hypothetical protein